MKEQHIHYGVYGVIIKEEKILLIKKKTGPYDGKLDLPGGSIEFAERPIDALKREFKEETGIEIINPELLLADSVNFKWDYKDKLFDWQHIGIFYKINSYSGNIKDNIKITNQNDDSLGANFYNISSLKKEELSAITILILEYLGYKLPDNT